MIPYESFPEQRTPSSRRFYSRMASLSRTLLVVCPEGPTLRVFTCVARFWGWSIGRAEVVELPSGALRPDVQSNVQSDLQPALQPEAIATAVRAIVLRWSVPPGVEVALVLPAFIGGVLSLSDQSRRAGTSVDMAWLEMELAGRIPFALRDIEYEAQPGAIGNERSIQVAWLPRTAAIEFRTAFARLGLVLGEIVFRPQLFATLLAASGRGPATGGRDLVIEQWAGSCFFHLLAAGRVLRTSMGQTHTPRGLADRLQLELLSLQAAGLAVSPPVSPVVSPVVSRVVLAGEQGSFDSEFEAAVKDATRGIKIERREAEISAMFVRFWRAGGAGIWLVPENPAALAIARRMAFAIAGIGALLAAAMTWNTSAIRDEIAVLEAREARLRPQYQPLAAKERQAQSAAATADSVARLSPAPSEPQAALLAVFNALPRSAWVTRFAFEEGKARVAGKGLDTESVIARLKNQPGVRRIVAASGDGPEATDGDAERVFRVGFHWAPVAPGAQGAPGAAVPPVPPGAPGREITDGKKKGPQ
jgi:hypothetical protein